MRNHGSCLSALAVMLMFAAAVEGVHLLAPDYRAASADGGTTALSSAASAPSPARLAEDIFAVGTGGGRRLLASDDDDADVSCDLSKSTPSEFQYKTQWTCKDPPLKTIRDASLTDCQTECACRSLCGAFSYNSERKDCYLKAECVLGQFDDDDISALKGSAQPPVAVPPVYLYFWDHRCAGPTVRTLWGKSQPQCEQACNTTPGCQAYSLKTSGRCELKPSCDQLEYDPTYRSAKLDTSAAPPAVRTFTDFSSAVYLPGSYCVDATINVLWDKSQPQCQNACVSTSGCQAYSLKTWGKCELKASCEIVVPDPTYNSVKASSDSESDDEVEEGTDSKSDDDSEEDNDSQSDDDSDKESDSESDSTADEESSETSDDADSDDDDGPSWGSVSFSGQTGVFSECRDEAGDDDDHYDDFSRFFCDSGHCVINCEGALGMDGLLVLDDWKGMPYCDSVHRADRYDDDRVCCCGDRVSSRGPKATIPCLLEDDDGDEDPKESCYYWCRVKSYQGWDDCAGGDYLCLPLGSIESEDTCDEYEDTDYGEIHDIECSKNEQCCHCIRFS